MTVDQWLAILQMLLVAGVAVLGVLVQRHRAEARGERQDIASDLKQVLEELELVAGDLRRELKGR